MEKSSKIYVAGHNGLVGSAIIRELNRLGYKNLITASHSSLDLTQYEAVDKFLGDSKPDFIFLAAAKVGGILANQKYPADFIRENLQIQTNVIDAAYKNKVERLLFLGSSCIYPKYCTQPIKEEYLLAGPLEATNDAYAIAKIAGIKMCESYNRQYGTHYISAMPTNLYGPGDNYDLNTSHVLPALIRKMHEAKTESKDSVKIWGSGKPLREFLYVDDMAEACVFLMNNKPNEQIFNIGTGIDITIDELAEKIATVVGYGGQLVYDSSKPDGTPKKLLDVSKIQNLGWSAKTDLISGIEKTYSAFLENFPSFKTRNNL